MLNTLHGASFCCMQICSWIHQLALEIFFGTRVAAAVSTDCTELTSSQTFISTDEDAQKGNWWNSAMQIVLLNLATRQTITEAPWWRRQSHQLTEVMNLWQLEEYRNCCRSPGKHRGSVLWCRVSLTSGSLQVLELENNSSSLTSDAHQGNDCHEWSEGPPVGEDQKRSVMEACFIYWLLWRTAVVTAHIQVFDSIYFVFASLISSTAKVCTF